MKIPDHIISEISDKADIVDIVSSYVQLKRKGSRYWGRCPFHSEKTPSFSVTPEKNMYYCFGCHAGGGVFHFLMEIEKISFVEAVKMVGKMVGITVTLSGNIDPAVTMFRESLIELYNRVAGSFHYILLHNKEAESARDYLTSRGVSKESIEIFKLGYAPADRNWLYSFLQKKNYTPDFLAKSGLFQTKYQSNHAYFSNRIIFPIGNARGETIAFGGRTLADIQPKYLNSPETLIYKKNQQLYGLDQALVTIKQEHHFYLVEGYLDMIAMHQAGIKNCIAPLGTALTENQVKLLKRYSENGTLIFDGDEAGFKATVKAIELLENREIYSKVVELPEQSDPADILQKDGISTLNKLLKCSINSFEYLINKAFFKYDYNTPAGKEKIFEFLFSYFEKVNSDVKRDGCLNILAERLDVDPLSVRKDYTNRKRPKKYYAEIEEKKINISDDLFLMLAITVNRDFFIQLRKHLVIEDFQDTSAKALYIALEECFREDKKTLESLLDKVDNDILKKVILEKNISDEFTLNADKIINDGIYRIKRRKLSKRQKEISYLLKKYEKSEPWRLKELLVEKMILDKEFEELKVIGNA